MSFSPAASAGSVGGQSSGLESVARALPFPSDPSPGGAHGSVSSISQATKLSIQKCASSFVAGEEHDDLAPDYFDKQNDEPLDKEADFVPVTDSADLDRVLDRWSPGGELAELVERHHCAFMERMFPPDHEQVIADDTQMKNKSQKISGSILSCRLHRVCCGKLAGWGGHSQHGSWSR